MDEKSHQDPVATAAGSITGPTPGSEPWLRGTHAEIPAVLRAVVHALELAEEDLIRWCNGLTDAEINAKPHGLPPVAFHLRHMARSMDRLLTYAEGRDLNASQLVALKTEMEDEDTGEHLMHEVIRAIDHAKRRVLAIRSGGLEAPRAVGHKQLPTTVGGLIVHVAEHTQRHVGQVVTTAKILRAQRG